MAQEDEQIEEGEQVEQVEESGDAETRVYELGFHLDGELPQEEVKRIYGEIRDRIAGRGTVVAEGESAKIPLAYTISRQETTGRRDFDTAFFCWIAYEIDGAGHQDIIEFARSLPSIVRFLDIRTTVDAAKHAAEMHELFAREALEGPGLEDETIEAEPEAEPAPKEAGV
jgi:ribosomal protein S6